MKLISTYLILILLINLPQSANAQKLPGDTSIILDKAIELLADTVSEFIHIKEIHINGNKKTKAYIINREIQFNTDDSIRRTSLRAQMEQARSQVYNTNLFTDVKFTSVLTSFNEVEIFVDVKERWYIYPSPRFQLIDRNFSEWIKVHNADLERVTYGAKYTQYNLSGRRDVLNINILTGYSRNLSFSYLQPFSNKKLTEGFSVSGSFLQNREIPFAVDSNNRFKLFRNGDFVRQSSGAAIAYISRKGYFRSHVFSFGIQTLSLKDKAFSDVNSTDYFHKNTSSVVFPDFQYGYQYSNTNNVNYPLTGRIYGTRVLKRGLGFTGGLNLLQLDAYRNSYDAYGKGWFGVLSTVGMIKLPFDQAFLNRRAIGFGGLFLRGLDSYVVDGVAAAVAKYTIRKKVLAFNMKVPIKNRFLQKIPFTFYAKTFADGGYAYNKSIYQSPLNNKLLYTGGVGIDMITFYDLVIGVDYSFNQLGEKGLFLRVQGGF